MSGLEMKYFVLNPSKNDAYGQASRDAMVKYADSIVDENPQLSLDLHDWVIRLDMNESFKKQGG